MATNASPNARPSLDDYVETIITTASRRLVSVGAIPSSDQENIEQDLRVAVLSSISGFDAAKSSWHTYANAVVQRALKQYLRARKAQCRDASRCISISNNQTAHADATGQDPAEALCLVDPRTAEATQRRDDAEEMLVFLSRLPEALRTLATLLMEGLSPAEVTERLEWSRETFYYYRRQLREAMQEAGLEPR